MGTKNKPGAFDCYANAEPDEPMFVLLARDEKAPDTVRCWVLDRQERRGVGRRIDFHAVADDKEREALACADAMEKWHAEHPK